MKIVPIDEKMIAMTRMQTKKPWPELEAMIKKLDKNEMAVIAGADWKERMGNSNTGKTRMRTKCKRIAGLFGKTVSVGYYKEDGSDDAYITVVS
ncbi:MAG: hypothetical protein ACYTEQ_01785 [Planctomycetota bacterium]|jgi:hypothetical protein